MPSPETLNAFVSAVVSNDHVGAIKDFYHSGARTSENGEAPTIGLTALIAKEEAALARVRSMHTHPPRAIAVNGDLVMINWIFDIVDPKGTVRRLDEVAVQYWEGDRIRSECFYYDSARAWSPVTDDADDKSAFPAA